MPKIRSVDPFFWDDPEIGQKLTRDERLLMVGCWTKLADDEGRFLADPAYVKKQVFGYDDLSISEVSGMLRRISEAVRSWKTYAVDGHEYIQIDPHVWKKHQDIRWVVRSKLPVYSNGNIDTSEDYGRIQNNSADSPRASRARVEQRSVAESSEAAVAAKEQNGIQEEQETPEEFCRYALLHYPGARLDTVLDDSIVDQCLRIAGGDKARLYGALKRMADKGKRPEMSWGWFPKVLKAHIGEIR